MMFTALEHDGFVLQKRRSPSVPTIEVAQALGKIVDIELLLPFSRIPSVQSLRPRHSHEVGQNQYSGHYGFGSFPLHSDLAHWALPPHYLLLRCVVGSNDVFTNILAWTPIVDLVGRAAMQKAVFAGRNRRIGCSSLVRALTLHQGIDIFRWDPIFLRPLNQHARALARVMLDTTWNSALVRIPLCEPGDTLLINNWQMLHGRSQILEQGSPRNIERVYLSEVFQWMQN
jgi:L-asparagine oxygenase